jgi:hypothetical protein
MGELIELIVEFVSVVTPEQSTFRCYVLRVLGVSFLVVFAFVVIFLIIELLRPVH